MIRNKTLFGLVLFLCSLMVNSQDVELSRIIYKGTQQVGENIMAKRRLQQIQLLYRIGMIKLDTKITTFMLK